jgi:hypothetical protein
MTISVGIWEPLYFRFAVNGALAVKDVRILSVMYGINIDIFVSCNWVDTRWQ